MFSKFKKKIAMVLISTLIVGQNSFINYKIAYAKNSDETQVNQEEVTRILFQDNFSANDGALWNASPYNTASKINFTNGMMSVIGGGAENRVSTKTEIQEANITIDFDLWLNRGNTNAAIKVGFKSDSNFNNRYQVTYDTVHDLIRLEKKVGSTITTCGSEAPLDLDFNEGGTPYHFKIDVNKGNVMVFVNEELKLTASDPGLNEAGGYFFFASQFPAQNYSVDNVIITTKEKPVGDIYNVTLKTSTNGVIDTSEIDAGGTLTADKLQGYAGEMVTLTPTAKRGYIFNGYKSYLTDSGNSTDGLLTIDGNSFKLDAKTGNVTIVADFIKKPIDPNMLFEDDFQGELNETGKYQIIKSVENAVVANGVLTLSTVGEEPNYIINPGSDWGINEEYEGYSIGFDIKKVNSNLGTVQIAFRIGSFGDRYVLALNGSKAMLRHLDSKGGNVELASTLYTFDNTSRHINITVFKDTVSVTSNGDPLLSYKNQDSNIDKASWSNISYGLGLINMTQNSPVEFDNILVKKVLPKHYITTEVTKNGEADTTYESGTISISPTSAAAGDVVTITATPKAGYELQGYYSDEVTITGNTFIMPSELSTDKLVVKANFIPVNLREGRNFYIDSISGNDDNSGNSVDKPWKSLKKVASSNFVPGDKILIKAGSVFNGIDAELTFKGSGSKGKNITVSTYGEGARPRLNGEGKLTNVVSLYNQEYITIEGLEITNLHPEYNGEFGLNTNNNRQVNLRGVNVSAKDFGIVNSIHIKDLYIHDVNGNLSSKWNGGIFFDIKATVEGGKLEGIPTKYDDILIEGCTIERVDRSAIKLIDSDWANQSLINKPGVPIHWYPSTNVVVRGNTMDMIGGDGITVRDTDGALIEYNLARDCRYQDTGYNAGIWPFQASNTVIQYNEVSRTHGTQDGQGFDTDHLSSYSVMQYNYSHDNFGGFMLIMNGFPHTGPTIRYNISQNDLDKTFEFSRGTPSGTMIYNNTIYSENILTGRGGVFDLTNTTAGTGNREIYVFNNIFHYPEGQKFYCGEVDNMKSKINLYNNAYFGGIDIPLEEENAITQDPMLQNIGSGPSYNTSDKPIVGALLKGELDGYKLTNNSPLIDKGVTVQEVIAKFGGTETDYRTLSPYDLHELAKQGESIDFAVGSNFPSIQGVEYDKDFFGNSLSSKGSKPDIGAMEFQVDEPIESQEDEPIEFQEDEPMDTAGDNTKKEEKLNYNSNSNIDTNNGGDQSKISGLKELPKTGNGFGAVPLVGLLIVATGIKLTARRKIN